MKSAPPDRDLQAGFSLVEAILAVAIIGAVLVISMSFLSTLVGSAARVQAQSEMLRELEAGLEMMRAGFLPLESGTLVSPGSSRSLPDLEVTAVVEKVDVPGLYRITVHANCTYRRSRISRSITTQVWRTF